MLVQDGTKWGQGDRIGDTTNHEIWSSEHLSTTSNLSLLGWLHRIFLHRGSHQFWLLLNWLSIPIPWAHLNELRTWPGWITRHREQRYLWCLFVLPLVNSKFWRQFNSNLGCWQSCPIPIRIFIKKRRSVLKWTCTLVFGDPQVFIVPAVGVRAREVSDALQIYLYFITFLVLNWVSVLVLQEDLLIVYGRLVIWGNLSVLSTLDFVRCLGSHEIAEFSWCLHLAFWHLVWLLQRFLMIRTFGCAIGGHLPLKEFWLVSLSYFIRADSVRNLAWDELNCPDVVILRRPGMRRWFFAHHLFWISNQESLLTCHMNLQFLFRSTRLEPGPVWLFVKLWFFYNIIIINFVLPTFRVLRLNALAQLSCQRGRFLNFELAWTWYLFCHFWWSFCDVWWF